MVHCMCHNTCTVCQIHMEKPNILAQGLGLSLLCSKILQLCFLETPFNSPIMFNITPELAIIIPEICAKYQHIS